MDPKLIPLKPVDSSHINAVGYDKKTKTLVVEFPAALWSYTPVTEGTYNSLMQADSVGKYFHAHIKTNTALKAERID